MRGGGMSKWSLLSYFRTWPLIISSKYFCAFVIISYLHIIQRTQTCTTMFKFYYFIITPSLTTVWPSEPRNCLNTYIIHLCSGHMTLLRWVEKYCRLFKNFTWFAKILFSRNALSFSRRFNASSSSVNSAAILKTQNVDTSLHNSCLQREMWLLCKRENLQYLQYDSRKF